MTDNHQLLFRLAELMLEHQQHILPVDVLFDDEQIGDFVKTIQIDSPYQQLLLEGVLTESFSDEKLWVCFTVEGYFHYVLGEVLFRKGEDVAPEFLKTILEHNALKGVSEGIEQCLLRDVHRHDLSRIMWLIDQGGRTLEAASLALAQAFLQQNSRTSSKEKQSLEERVEAVLAQVFAETSDNDVIAIEKAIEVLEAAQKRETVSAIYVAVNRMLTPNSVRSALVLARSVNYIDKSLRLVQLQKLEEACHSFSQNEHKQALLTVLGSEYKREANYEKALHYFESSLVLSRILNGEQHVITAVAHSDVGSVWSERGDYDQALQCYTTSLNIRIDLHGEYAPQTAAGYSNVGAIFSKKGNIGEALENYNKALSIRMKTKGSFHLDTALSYTNVGAIFSKQNELEQARKCYLHSLEIRESILGSNHLDTAVSLTNMGAVYSKLGNLEEALSYYQKSLSNRLKHLDHNHPDLALNLTNIGAIYSKKNDHESALDYYHRVLEIRLSTLGENHDKTALSMVNYGSVLVKLHREPEAKAYFQRALPVYNRVFGEDHEKTIKLQKKLAKLG